MSLQGAKVLKELSQIAIRTLTAIETGMRRSEYVNIETIAKFIKYNIASTEKILQKCHKLNLIHRWTGHYVGYELTIHGYDALGLNALYEKGTIRGIGREKGVGKESRVYYGLDANDQEVILKLHRVGFTSFHQFKKKRTYTANKQHLSELYVSRLSAQTEYEWLQHAHKMGLNVPKPIDWNRHIIVEELILGSDLVKLKKLTDPEATLHAILDFMKTAWQDGNFVHGDLSEHNIIINYDEIPIIFDFPQTISSKEQNSIELLERDVDNILTFFERKHKISLDRKETIKVILDE